MSELIQLKRTSVQDKRPVASGLSLGEPAIGLHEDSFGLFFKDASNNIRKIGPIHVGATAPNTSPAGSSGNSVGEGWLSTVDDSLSIWDGSQWVVVSSAAASIEEIFVDFGLATGSLDYGLITNSHTSSEDWGVLSLLTN